MCSGLFSWQDNSREWNSDLHWLLYQCCNTVTRHAMRWEIIVMIYLLNVDIHGPPILLHELKNKILSMSLNLCLIINENWPNDLNISIFYFEANHFMAQMFQLYLQLISKVVDMYLHRYRPKKWRRPTLWMEKLTRHWGQRVKDPPLPDDNDNFSTSRYLKLAVFGWDFGNSFARKIISYPLLSWTEIIKTLKKVKSVYLIVCGHNIGKTSLWRLP